MGVQKLADEAGENSYVGRASAYESWDPCSNPAAGGKNIALKYLERFLICNSKKKHTKCKSEKWLEH